MKTENRLFYIDNLRIMLTILVIVHHVGQAYGPTGGFWPVQEALRAPVLGPFFSVNRSFFMSLFFMISGYFMVASYEKNGARAFITSRLVRLGIPILVYAIFMIPVRTLMFGARITRWDEVFNADHLWYLEHLLLFSCVYALWRWLRRDRQRPDRSTAKLPGVPVILAFALAIAVASALIRIWSPIDRWMNLAGFFRVAFADVPRDLAFFVVGAIAHPRKWFERWPAASGFAWLAVGLAAAALWYVLRLAVFPVSPTAARIGGIVYPIWEALLACGMCIGLLVLFREALNVQGALGRFLAANQYAAYVWHPLIIVPIQMAIFGVTMGPFLKFLLVSAVGVPIVYLWSGLFRWPRLVRAVL